MSALIRFDEVSLAFGDQAILRQASFPLEPRERVCLIGRNGAGKSSTLKLLTGELEPDDGAVAPDRTDIHGITLNSMPFRDYRLIVADFT